ncbi:MAG: phage holin family protein [Sneathiella sp.]
MKDYLPPDLWQSLASTFGVLAAAVLGRLVYHARLVQRQERDFFSRHILFELIIALGVGYAANGVMVYLGLEEDEVRIGGIVILSYLGPGGIEYLLVRYFNKSGTVK